MRRAGHEVVQLGFLGARLGAAGGGRAAAIRDGSGADGTRRAVAGAGLVISFVPQ